MLVAHRDDRRLDAHARSPCCPRFLDPGDLVVVNTSGTIPAARRRRRRRRHAARRAPLDPARRPAAGWSSRAGPTAARRERWTGPPPPRHLALGEGARARAGRARTGDSGRLWVAALDLPAAGAHLAGRARPADPLRLRRAAVAARAPTRTSTPPSPAAPRCRAPAGRSRPRSSPGSSPRASASRRSCCTPAWRRSRPTSCRTPSGCGSRRRPPTRVNATHDAGGRVVAVGTTVVRALETAVDDRRRRRAVRRLDRPRDHARARRAASSTGCSPAGTSPRRRTC